LTVPAALLALASPLPPARAADGTAAVGAGDAALAWHFAEGYTGEGFQEYLCVFNPGELPATARVSFLFSEGPPLLFDLPVAPRSRSTLDVNAATGHRGDVSMTVLSDHPVTAERPMYFTYRNKWSGCSNVVGSTAPSRRWSFAEGTTRQGFEEWLCLANPGEEDAAVLLELAREDGAVQQLELAVPARQRRTVEVGTLVEAGHDVSALVLADREILAERAMYFHYRGRWQGGHASFGRPAEDSGGSRFFAEGYTGAGFETWLCLYLPSEYGAPGSAAARGTGRVELTYYYEGGPSVNEALDIPTDQRLTLFLNQRLGEGKNLSVKVEGPPGIMAERPMYFDYKGVCRGGHVTSGAASARTEWLFAEGTLRPGFEEWLCLANPGDQACQASVDLYASTGETLSLPLSIPPATRSTLCLNDAAPGLRGLDVSCAVRSDRPLAAERSMYYPGAHFEPLNAMDNLAYLTQAIGPRVEGTAEEEAAAAFLSSALAGYSVGGRGFEVSVQRVPLPNGAFTRNVVGKLAPEGGGGVSPVSLVILGAHMDTRDATGSPGANDNGSGCVTVLEVARCLAQGGCGLEVWVIFFGGEEQLVPGTDLHHFGSRWFVDHLGAEDRARLHGAIVVDMVGVGSQLYARTMGIGPMDLCNRLMAFAAGRGIYLPYLRSGNSSDHEPFEKAGLQAVWLEYKDDPYYHSPADSIDKVNPEYLRLTGSLILDYLRSL
jgi:hypothetical protein